jgi:acyl carrier protein
MSQQIETAERLDELREIVSDVLELEPGELTGTGDFLDEYGADSLRAIEILARIDKKYKIEIPQMELPRMRNLNTVYEVVATYADW